MDDHAATSTKEAFGYASMGSRRKRLAGAIACVSIVCLGAGIAAGVLIERSVQSHGSEQKQALNAVDASPSTPTNTTPNDTISFSSNTSSASRPKIVLVGDLHTELGSEVDGWATRLQSRYVRTLDVLNRGLAEFNTERFVESALPIVSNEFATTSTPALITVWFGTTDAALPHGPDARDHVRVERFYDNLVHILRTFRKRSPLVKLLVVSPPPVDDDARHQRLADQLGELSDTVDHTNNATAAYATASAEAATVLRDANISFLDLYAHLMAAYPNATARGALLRDGLRLSAEGQRVAFEQIHDRIQKLLPATTLDTVQIPTPAIVVEGH